MTDEKQKLIDTDANGLLSNVDLENPNNVRIIKAALEKAAEWENFSDEQREKFMQNPSTSLHLVAHKTGAAAIYANASLEELREELAQEENHPDKEGFNAMIEVAIALNETFPFGIEITEDALSPSDTPTDNAKVSSPERK